MITILGPTASGKTGLATALADRVNGEIISADSRQVYRGMNIGTGKDLEEYRVNDKVIPYHLIDIHEPGYEYNVFEFQKDFHEVYKQFEDKPTTPILCGGTGMYIDAVLKGYKLIAVPRSEVLRESLDRFSHEELVTQLGQLAKLHNTSDSATKDRTIRAIEIAKYYEQQGLKDEALPPVNTKIFGINWERGLLKERITARLKQRLEEGMVQEVEQLINQGVAAEKLKYYGLEYKFIVQFLEGDLSYNDMYQKLNTAIHQFAKRQITWFRRMEKQGKDITWIDGQLPLGEQVDLILKSSA